MGSRIIGSNPTSTSNAKLPFSTSGGTLLYLDFLVTGIVMTFLGPMLPALSARWSLTDEQAGYLLFAQFFSSMFGMLASGQLVLRIGYRLTLIVGLLLMASGMSLLVSGPWLLGMIAVCVLGVGHGVTTPAGNLRTAEVNPERRASALSVINAVWGIGAVSSPFLAAIAQRAHRTPLFFYGTAAALLALLLAFAFARFEPDTRARTAPSSSPVESILNRRMLPVICALFFVYVGTEVSFGGWLASYAHRMGGDAGQHSFWALTTSFFWGALLVGRILAPAALKFHKETAVARIGLVLALAGGLTIVAAHGMALLIPGAILAGLGLASIFPISVSLLPRWFEESVASSSSLVFASGNTGGAVLPWLVGVISTHTGSLRFGFIVPLVGVAAMLGFYVMAGSPDTRMATRT
jgi:FHS family glucose/mannose:H+ symporter-like MFS transporter